MELLRTRNLGLITSLLASARIYSECDTCNTNLPSPPLVSRKTLSGLGTLAYAITLLGSLRDAPWVSDVIRAAVMAHLWLLGYSVLVLKKVCPICIAAAGGAALAYSDRDRLDTLA